jgi:hypothetical protein
VISLAERVAAVALENKLSFLNTVFGPEIYKVPIPKMVLNVWSLSEVELLQFLTLNLYGFDPGLEAGSR